MSHDKKSHPDNDSDERYLAQISSLIDGELGRDDLLDALDYLVGTPSAREFYRSARAVDGLFQGLGRKPVSEPPSRDLWKRISERAREPGDTPVRASSESAPAGVSHFPGAPRTTAARVWLAAAAVVLLAALGLISTRVWESRPISITSSPPIERPSEVVVGGAEGEMTDSRFLLLATELLEADRRYRQEMLALMAAVEEAPMAEATTQETRYGEASRSWENDNEPSESDPLRSRPRIERW